VDDEDNGMMAVLRVVGPGAAKPAGTMSMPMPRPPQR